MKQSKKIIAIIMSIVLLLSAMPMLMASAEYEWYQSGYWHYTLENGEAMIDAYGDDIPGGAVYIPETIDGYPVTGIGYLSSAAPIDVYIHAGITFFSTSQVNARSFTVDEANPVFSSEDGVLFNKDKTVLIRYPAAREETNYAIPSGVTSLYKYAFNFCDNLQSVTIPDSVNAIGGWAFRCCSNLETITLPDGLITIGDCAFEACDSLATITIPESVTSIGYGSFEYCNNLTGITVDTNNKNYSSDCYGVLFNKEKTSLIKYPKSNSRTYYEIPDSVTEIYSNAFCGSSNLIDIQIGENVTTIGDCAFNVCDSIRNIILPNSVTTIGYSAFEDCSSLETITLGNNITTINSYAFAYCTDLKAIKIPDSVTYIGEGVFEYCYDLEDVTLGCGIEDINSCTFSGCNGLKSLVLPDGIKTIAPFAFSYTGLESIYIPSSVTEIDVLAFCGEPMIIYYASNQSEWNSILTKTNPDEYDYTDPDINDFDIRFNYVLQSASGSCGENAVWNYDGMNTLTISGGGAMAEYPQGENAPWNEYASKIITLEIKEGITEIDGFYNCKNLDAVILPESLKRVESCAFCWDVNKDVKVIYGGMPEEWSDIEFGTHESDACFCYYIGGAVYIDNEEFSIDSISLSAKSTTVKYGETVSVCADVTVSDDGWIYFLPVGTQLNWYGDDNGFFISMVYDDYEYICDMTSENSGTTVLTVCLENEYGETLYNNNGKPIESSIELTSEAGIFELIAYFFRVLFNKILSIFMF